MYVYFSSEYPAAVKSDGIYRGSAGEEPTLIDLDPSRPHLIEVCPLVSGERQCNFLSGESFLSFLPDTVAATDLKGGYFLRFMRSYSKREFTLLGQKKTSLFAATVFNENGLKISLETSDDFFAENLYADVSSVKFDEFEDGGNKFLCVTLCGKKNTLAVYRIDGKIRKEFYKTVEDFNIQNGLSTTEKFVDIAKHEVTVRWKYDGGFKRGGVTISRSEKFDVKKLNRSVLPYAFAEELCVGGDVKEYLAENMIKNTDKLKGFFGEFVGVAPPPPFRRPEEVGLIKAVAPNRYKMDYYLFNVDGGKINDVDSIE